MKILIVYSHPNPKSFCHAILEKVTQELKEKKHSLEVRDLYRMNFQPVLKADDFAQLSSGKTPADIKAEQDLIRWADLFVVIYPLWWTGLPAMIKGYVDRIFTNGFAFAYTPSGVEGLLKGKKAILLTTQGTPAGYYESSGMIQSMKQTSDAGIFQFCGIEVVDHKFFAGVPSVDDKIRQGYLEQVKASLSLVK